MRPRDIWLAMGATLAFLGLVMLLAQLGAI
jgi:hypothetical protein